MRRYGLERRWWLRVLLPVLTALRPVVRAAFHVGRSMTLAITWSLLLSSEHRPWHFCPVSVPRIFL